MTATSRTYHVVSTTLGCATNLQENAAWRAHLESQGWTPCADRDAADLILVNTCAYSQAVEDATTRLLEELERRRRPTQRVVVAGCLPGINPERLAAVFAGEELETPRPALDFFAEQHELHAADFGRLTFKHHAVLFLRSWYFSAERLLGRRFQPLHHVIETVMVNERYHLLTVARGCLGTCTYCAIRHAKGRVQSRPLDAITRELDAALDRGVRDFWLLGDDVGCWGQDLGSDLPALLAALLARPAPFRLVVNYLDPTFLLKYGPELARLLADPRVIGLNVPIQSGSPTVLRRMGRSPEIERVMAWIAAVKRRNPGLAVKTNLMVGFPGETWADLLRTWGVLFGFDAAVALPYSPRPRTPAATLPGQHGAAAKRLRLELTNLLILSRHLQVAARSLIDSPRRDGLA